MKPVTQRLQVCAVAAIVCFSGTACAAAPVTRWQVLPEKSSIEWTATYGDKPVKGTFSALSADMTFDPAHLDASKVGVKVQIASLKSNDHDAQDNLLTGDWFAAAQYPVAVFETTGFTHIKDDDYQAVGTLTIRDRKANVTLPFTVKFYDDKDTSPPTHYARIDGAATLKRLDFGIGTGDWAKTDVIADPVKVDVHLEAKQVP